MRSRTDILNFLADRYRYGRFLEIGVKSGVNQRKVRCSYKVGVDIDAKTSPTYCMSSGEFFRANRQTFDLVFIDGDHTEEAVREDLTHALGTLEDGGTIVMHDCNPDCEWVQRPKAEFRGQKGERWCGTAWRAYCWYRMTRRDLAMCVVDVDEGVGIIQRGRQIPFHPGTLEFEYRHLEMYRVPWLNLLQPDELKAWLDERDEDRVRA